MNPLILALILVIFAGAAWAQSATLPNNLSVYAWLATFAALGGLVSFARKVRAGTTRWLNINELLGEMVTSGFVGVVTGLLLTAIDAPNTLVFAAAGITGHMGGRAIFWFEQAMQKTAEKRLGVVVDPDKTSPGIK